MPQRYLENQDKDLTRPLHAAFGGHGEVITREGKKKKFPSHERKSGGTALDFFHQVFKDQVFTIYFIEWINFHFPCNQPSGTSGCILYLIVEFSLAGDVECPTYVFLAKNNVDQVLAYQLYY